MDKGNDKLPNRRGDGEARRSTARPGVAPLGDALRGVYDQTVGEAVPQEMLDLLGKLG